jgi:hypothetical protein
MEPAIEESTVTFVCPLGQILNGPTISMCINGNWFPDPSDLQCSGEYIMFDCLASNLALIFQLTVTLLPHLQVGIFFLTQALVKEQS